MRHGHGRSAAGRDEAAHAVVPMAALSRRGVLRGLAGAGLAGTALPLGGCDLLYPKYCWNQKLVLVVDTPDGERRGESVSHVCYSYHIHMHGQGYAGTLKRAEAVVVDLGKGRYLFATINRWQDLVPIHCKERLKALGAKVVHPYAYMNPKATWHKLVKKLKGQRCPIAPDDLPLLVTFEDINDPETVKRVDPWDLDAAFGCDQDTGPKPWRAKGISVRLWHAQQMALRAAREVTKEMGLSPQAGELLARYQFSIAKEDLDDLMKGVVKQLGPMEEWDAARARLKELGVDGETWSAWERRFLARYRELSAQPPRDTARDCYRLKAAWVEVTDEPVTTGRVEKVLGWIKGHRGRLKPTNKKYERDLSVEEKIYPSDFLRGAS